MTEADRGAEKIITDHMRQQLPTIPFIGEETYRSGSNPKIGSDFFLIDPLDGTREFIAGRDEFTVNIALISHNKPVYGLIYAPALGEIYITLSATQAVVAKHPLHPPSLSPEALDFTALHCRSSNKQKTAIASRSHRDEETNHYLQTHGITNIISAGSSLKFCRLAEGKADIYPRFGPTMEWDIAAGHAILAASGGQLVQIDGTAFVYGKIRETFEILDSLPLVKKNNHFISIRYKEYSKLSTT